MTKDLVLPQNASRFIHHPMPAHVYTVTLGEQTDCVNHGASDPALILAVSDPYVPGYKKNSVKQKRNCDARIFARADAIARDVARSLGADTEVGSIEAGKNADLTVLDRKTPAHAPKADMADRTVCPPDPVYRLRRNSIMAALTSAARSC